ncbi:hypothetical protein Gotur_018313, partial [Gossypium turneri]
GVEGLDGLDASIKGLEEVDGGLNSSVEKAGEEGVEDETRQKVREVEEKTSGKAKETILDEIESESFGEQFEAEVLEEVEGEGLNNRVSREEKGNETKYFDSYDHGSILRSDDDDNSSACRKRNRSPHIQSKLSKSTLLYWDAV